MKVALVHDWLTGMRGGERVLEQMIELYPGAEIHTLLHIPGTVSETIEACPIQRCTGGKNLCGTAVRYWKILVCGQRYWFWVLV